MIVKFSVEVIYRGERKICKMHDNEFIMLYMYIVNIIVLAWWLLYNFSNYKNQKHKAAIRVGMTAPKKSRSGLIPLSPNEEFKIP